MFLVLALGSNQGDKLNFLYAAQKELHQHFQTHAVSRIYQSAAVDYTQQPDFYNQVIEYQLPCTRPHEILSITKDIEQKLGRRRDIPKGPRTIDIDILFYGLETFSSEQLTIPHSQWNKRSFVVYPLLELPCSKVIQKQFTFPSLIFGETAYPLEVSPVNT